ncbi:MAG: protein kinase [Planctomycetes bacterium]|nr:protein kinase [Planctomycetota bacterium]
MKPNAPDSQGDAQEFLDDVFEHAVRLIEEGRPAITDELLDGRENLRADVERLIRLASQIASGPVRRMPVIGGYDVLHELGHGGMGTVYLARQESLGGRPVALKVLPVSTGLSPRARDRFTFEARAIARLRHPNIVAIHDVLDEDGLCAYAMEWVDGTSLAAWIDERRVRCADHLDANKPMLVRESLLAPNSTGFPSGSSHSTDFPHLDVPFICRLGISIAHALAAVHKTGILHRDVKPSNILLRRDGTALLADFGLAREVDSSIHTQDGRFAGTVAYAPPEQLRGDTARVDARSDLYALGVTLYHALALQLPFEAREPVAMLRQIESGLSTPLRKLNPRVPRDLETIITKAIDPDPDRRYQMATEFAEDLERLLGFQPIHARRASLATRSVKLLRRNRAAAIGLTIGSLLTILIATGLVTYFFFVPGWVAGQVRNARLALLDPKQANSIVSVLYWGPDKPIAPAEQDARKKAFTTALASYDKALWWAPFDKDIRREREVVQSACDPDTTQRSDRSRFPDPRDRGLFAFLTNDFDAAIKSWEQYEQQRDPLAQPDPLVDAALGVLYLFNDQSARAYPRLQQAVMAFPGVGFLLEYLADAAAKCGDAERAERWLNEAKKLSLSDPRGAQNRIRASILAASDRDDDAEAILRKAPPNTPAAIEYALFLEKRGRLPEALNCYAASASAMPGERVQRLFVDAADRWWADLSPKRRLHKIRTTLDESPFARESFVALLRQYQTATGQKRASISPTAEPLAPWPLDPSAPFLSSLFMTLTESFSSPSLQSLSLSELAEQMEVMDMWLWSQISTYPRVVKEFNLAALRWPVFQSAAQGMDFVVSRLSVAATQFHNRKMHHRAIAIAALTLGVMASQPANGQCTTPPCFQGLGDLPGDLYFSRALQISADGQTVVGDSRSANSTHPSFGEPFRWCADTGLVGLGDLSGHDHGGPAYGVSADGSIVSGWSSSADGCVADAYQEGFRWTQATGMTGLGVGAPGCCESYGFGMADDGKICGGVMLPGCTMAMSTWTTVNGWEPVTQIQSNGWGVSRNGQWVIGDGNNNGNMMAARWSSQSGFEFLSGASAGSFAYGVANDGSVVGRNGAEAFLWTSNTGMINLGDLPGGAVSSLARKISADGTFIVGEGNSAIGTEAVLWGETRAIHRLADVLADRDVTIPAGWLLQKVTGITITGSIVSLCGIGANPQGNTEGWIARYTICNSPPCFQGLGDLPGGAIASHTDHFGGTLSSDGSTVVGNSTSTSGTEAFRWTALDGMVGLGDGSGGTFFSTAFATTPDGTYVVGMTDTSQTSCSNQEAFRWSQSTGLELLGDAPGGCFWSLATGISADGSVICGVSYNDTGYLASYLTMGGSWVQIGPNPSSFTGVSADGSKMAGNYAGELFYWTASTGIVNIGDLPGGSTEAYTYGITPDGNVIFGYGATGVGRQGLRWTQATGMVPLDDLPGGVTDSIAFAVAPNNLLTVGWGSSTVGTEAVIWDENLSIHRVADVLTNNGVTIPLGWTLLDATGVTVVGNVVVLCGNGTNPSGDAEAWIARYTIPCPGHTGDMNGDTFANGRDIAKFTTAVLSSSNQFEDTCPGDFDNNGTMDLPDIPGFVSILLTP